MTITGFITAVLVGLVIGALARLILPGKQPVGIIVTIIVGIVAALLGTWLTNEMGIGDAKGYDLMEFLAQLVLAVVGVGLASLALRGRARV